MTDTIDTIKNNLIVSVICAYSLYTDTMTRLTRSFLQTGNPESFIQQHKDNAETFQNSSCQRVNVSKGDFVPKSMFFADTIKNSLIVSIVSRGVF